jgi:hypothetical protein
MNEIHRVSDEAMDEIRRSSSWRNNRPEMITRNSANQPWAQFLDDAVLLVIPLEDGISPRIRLSAAKAEELAIELEHAAKMMRGEV